MGKPNLFRRAVSKPGLSHIVPQNDPALEYLHMDLLRLEDGGRCGLGDPQRELGLVVLGGKCTLDGAHTSSIAINARSEPLEGWPHAVYVPAGKKSRVARPRFDRGRDLRHQSNNPAVKSK